MYKLSALKSDVDNLELCVGSASVWLDKVCRCLVRDIYVGQISMILRDRMPNIDPLLTGNIKSWQKAYAWSCKFILSKDNLLYRVANSSGYGGGWLDISTEFILKILPNAHDAIAGSEHNRVKPTAITKSSRS
jgi:hypothetical protein